MLSIFPSILFLAPFSALLIRLALAIVFSMGGWKHFSDKNLWLALLEIIVAVSVAVGVSTQIAAIAGAIIIGVWLFVPRLRPFAKETVFLSLVLCLSLIITGAGALAFDLPL